MINKFLPEEISTELNMNYPLSVGYYWVEDDSISYWNPNSHGSLAYEGELSLLEVCNRLNEESKKMFSLYIRRLPFEYQEGEDKIKAIVRVRKEYGLGLKEAKDLVEGEYDLPPCVVIKGGPLNNLCKVSYEYIPIGLLEVIPLPIKQEVVFSKDELWELDCSSYSFPYILFRSSNSSNYVQAFLYPNGHIKYELGEGNKEYIKEYIVYKGDLDTCLSLSNKFKEAFKEGQKNTARRFLDLSNGYLED